MQKFHDEQNIKNVHKDEIHGPERTCGKGGAHSWDHGAHSQIPSVLKS